MCEFKICDEIIQKYYTEYLENYREKSNSKSKFHCHCGKYIKYIPTIFKSHFFSKRHQKYLIEMEEIKNDFKTAVILL
jgi:hypothetical protein